MRRSGPPAIALALGALVLLRAGHDAPGTASGPGGLRLAASTAPPTLALGPAGSPHRLVLFTDYQCAACARLDREAGPQLRALALRGRLRLEVRHFPLAAHRRAGRAAETAACAARQGKGWDMHEALLRTAPRWSGGGSSARRFSALADALGLDPATLAACLRGPEVAAALAADRKLGLEAGVKAVPTVLLDGSVLVAPTPRELVRRVAGATR